MLETQTGTCGKPALHLNRDNGFYENGEPIDTNYG